MNDDVYNDRVGDGQVHFGEGQIENWGRYINETPLITLTSQEVNRLLLTSYNQHIFNREVVFLLRLLCASHADESLKNYLKEFEQQADATGNAYNNLIGLFMARGSQGREDK